MQLETISVGLEVGLEVIIRLNDEPELELSLATNLFVFLLGF